MTQLELTPTSSLTGKWKPYPAYKDSGVEWLGQVPANWRIGKIGAACTVKARLGWRGLKASEYINDGYIFLATPNIKGSEIDFENVNYITAERYFESPEIMVKVGDVLVAKDGSTLGITSVIRHLPAPTTVNSSIAIIRPHKLLDSVFLYWFLSSNYIQAFIQRMKDGMGVPHLFQADLRKFIVLAPSFEEQHAIATFLDRETARIYALIAKKERLIELLQEKRAALISHAVTKGLDSTVPMKDSEVEWLGEIPVHWEVVQLRRVVDKFVDYRGATPTKVIGGVPLITARNIKNGAIDFTLSQEYISEKEYSERMVRGFPKVGDVLITTEAPLGETAQIIDAYIALAQRIILLKLSKSQVTNDYVKYFFMSGVGRGELWSRATGSTAIGIKASHLKETLIIVPTLSEQLHITAYLDHETAKIDALISRIRDGIEKLREYSAALISSAVTGKIDVREEITLPDDGDL